MRICLTYFRTKTRENERHMADRKTQQRARKEQSKNRDQKKRAGRDKRPKGSDEPAPEQALGLDALIEQSKSKATNTQSNETDEGGSKEEDDEKCRKYKYIERKV